MNKAMDVAFIMMIGWGMVYFPIFKLVTISRNLMLQPCMISEFCSFKLGVGVNENLAMDEAPCIH